jgi:hypothetical protein
MEKNQIGSAIGYNWNPSTDTSVLPASFQDKQNTYNDMLIKLVCHLIKE